MMGCHIDITERKKAEQQIEHFAELFQALSHRLLEVQEEERRHLARELHDEIGQALTAAKLNLKIIAPEVPPAAAGRLEDSIQILDRLLQQVRQLSLDLRPPLLDELGLVLPCVGWPISRRSARGCVSLSRPIRHASAETVALELRHEADRLCLSVRDDGVGFDPSVVHEQAGQGASIGLLSMKERVSLLGGELEVNSAPERGTEIRAWFPTAPHGQSFAAQLL